MGLTFTDGCPLDPSSIVTCVDVIPVQFVALVTRVQCSGSVSVALYYNLSILGRVEIWAFDGCKKGRDVLLLFFHQTFNATVIKIFITSTHPHVCMLECFQSTSHADK